MGTVFYFLTGVWAIAMIAIFICAIRLSYRIEARSPQLANKNGVPQRAKILNTVMNWKVARDEETQARRRRMVLLLLLNLAGFAVLWTGLYLSGRA